jgi:cell division protein FtsA
MTTKESIAAIEIGSSKIAGMVGRRDSGGNLEVLAYATENSSSFIRKGIIFNIDKAVIGLKSIIDNLERSLEGQTISKVYVCICGQSFRSLRNVVCRELPESISITEEMVDSICEENRTMKLADLDIFDVIPQGYHIGTISEMDPIGVIGNRIEGCFLNIVGRSIIRKNLERCFSDARIKVADDPSITSTITAKYVLTESERRLGCALIDFGADTTTVSIYHKNILRFLAVIPLGSSSITHDLMSLNIDENEAEELKVHYGSAILEISRDEEEIIHLNEESHSVKLSEINNIVEARAMEIIANVWNQIQLSGYSNRLGSGLIFTGGGSNLRNLSTAFCKYVKRNPKIRTASLVYESSISGLAIPNDGTINALIGLTLGGRENCCERIFTQPIVNPIDDVKPNDTIEEIDEGGLSVSYDNDSNSQYKPDDAKTVLSSDEDSKKSGIKLPFWDKLKKQKKENVEVEDPAVVEQREYDREQEQIRRDHEKAERDAQREIDLLRKAEEKEKLDALRAQRLEKERILREKKKEEDRIKKEQDRINREKKKKDNKFNKALNHLTDIFFNEDQMKDDND